MPVLLLCRVDGSDQNPFDFQAIIQNRACHICIQVIGFFQNMQPILSFSGFFQGNMKLCDEISLAVAVLCFVDICADGGAAA